MNRLNVLSICFFSLFLFACGSKPIGKVSVSEQMRVVQDVNEFVDAWHQAASNADFEAYFSKIAEDGIFVGTDEEEVWTKQQFAEFSEPFFKKGRAWDFKKKERHIYQDSGNYIWFNETIDTWMGVCRGSGTLKRNPESGELEIKQYVLSLTVPNESVREVMKVIEETEE